MFCLLVHSNSNSIPLSWIKPSWPLYYTRSTGAESCGVVAGPSLRGADYLAIEYERDWKTITHDCASFEKIRFVMRSA